MSLSPADVDIENESMITNKKKMKSQMLRIEYN